ncbi:DsrE family protein [Lactiplantibacillus daowaiensis]|uniref:DsrE family protein n=1 Tax=Lactiplantibacillus daowaiensis TaxID=2559918 RepID=A0ABW1S059_9LACO|nr:DsrE family protein [Lactiplantibacillus daowaiensis]
MPKVVVHIDEVAKVAMAMGNVRNLLAALPTSKVIIVVNGPAVTTLTSADWATFITDNPQVEIDACHNALMSHQLVATDLVAGVKVVPAGVVRIVELEAQGFNYLKP